MQYDFPDPFEEEVPEDDLLLDSFPVDMFDYMDELQELAVDMADEQTAGQAPEGLLTVLGQQRQSYLKVLLTRQKPYAMQVIKMERTLAMHLRACRRFWMALA